MRLTVPTAVAAALAFSCGAVLAQEIRTDEYPGGTPTAMAAEPQQPVFGSAGNLLQIPSSAFTVRDSTTVYAQDGVGYVYSTSAASTTVFWAPVDLPAGVVIDRLGLYYFDGDAANSISARLQTYEGTTTPGTTTVATVSSPAGTGTGYATVALSHQVNNNASVSGGHHYYIVIDIPVRTINLRFRAVELLWHRVVSPAPGTATFPSDVPTTHPFFRFVEAMAASGLTGGCGSGAFCPDAPVTRGQMAVFLSTALGLHFPN